MASILVSIGQHKVAVPVSSGTVTYSRFGGAVLASLELSRALSQSSVGARCEVYGASGVAMSGVVSSVSGASVEVAGLRDALDAAVLNRRYLSRAFANVTVTTLPGKEGFRWDVDNRECVCNSETNYNYSTVEHAKDYVYVDVGGPMKRLVLDWSRNGFYKFWIYVEGAARVYRAGGASDSGTLDYTCAGPQFSFVVYVANNSTGTYANSYPARFRFPTIYYYVANPTATNVLADALAAAFPASPPVTFADTPAYTLESEDTFETLGALVDHIADAARCAWLAEPAPSGVRVRFVPVDALDEYRIAGDAIAQTFAGTYSGLAWRGGTASASSSFTSRFGAPLARAGWSRALLLDADRAPSSVDDYLTGVLARGLSSSVTVTQLRTRAGARLPAAQARPPFTVRVADMTFIADGVTVDLVSGETTIDVSPLRIGRVVVPAVR